jgi:hypothetical protein
MKEQIKQIIKEEIKSTLKEFQWGKSSRAKAVNLSDKEMQQVAAQAQAKNRAIQVPVPKYVMKNGVPHKVENGKLIPFTKKETDKYGYLAIMKKHGVNDAVAEICNVEGDVTAEEVSAILNISTGEARKALQAIGTEY